MSGARVYLNELGIICALGAGRVQVRQALFAADAPGGVAVSEAMTPGRPIAIGHIRQALPEVSDRPVPLRGRNNALLSAAFEQIRDATDQAIGRYGAER